MRTRRPRPAPAVRSAFAGFRFPPDVTVVAVRWYLRFGLSYRDVEELLAERGVEVDHVTVYRWVKVCRAFSCAGPSVRRGLAQRNRPCARPCEADGFGAWPVGAPVLGTHRPGG